MVLWPGEGRKMIELKRKVKKEIEETYEVELVPFWNVRILTPNGNRTYFCRYEEKFSYEPKEQEIASVLAEHSVKGAFASVCKNYELVEKDQIDELNPFV